MNKQQLTNLIGAGTIATLMLILGLVFNGQRMPAAAEVVEAAPVVQVVEAAPVEAAGALEIENQQLRDTVQILQEREAQFVEQINLANEQLAAPAGEYGEGEAYEEEYEEEEDEHGEYEMEEGEVEMEEGEEAEEAEAYGEEAYGEGEIVEEEEEDEDED